MSASIFQKARSHWPLLAALGLLALVGVLLLVARKKPATEITEAAPEFTLRDQRNQSTSLAQFRGKVVVMTFIDPECHQVCPLTTESLLRAEQMLGPADASRVQLVGIDANPEKLAVSDLAAYTDNHGLRGRWRFLTGTPQEMQRVWKEYHVYVANAKDGDAVHESVTYVIDGQGFERAMYSTPMRYEAVEGEARLMAGELKAVLERKAPPFATDNSVAVQEQVTPAQRLTLPPLQPGLALVKVGGKRAQLLVFFGSWVDASPSALARDLAGVQAYGEEARRRNWPAPVLVDETPTEVSPAQARAALIPLAQRLRVPIVEDITGKLADGDQVQDLPWMVLRSKTGTVAWTHDGWLTPVAMERQVARALQGVH